MSIYSIEDGCDEAYLHNHLEKYCKQAKISNYKFSITKCSEKGDNFVGLVYRTKIEGKLNGKDKTIYAILKLASRSKERRTRVTLTRSFFLREVYFFNTIVPLFQEANIEIKNIPQLYYYDEEEYSEALLLEDLSVRDFCCMRKDKFTSKREAKLTDYNHASLALKHLGKFHANSFIVREKRPDIFKQFQTLQEPLFVTYDKYKDYVKLLFKVMRMAFEEDATEYQKLKFKLFEENYFEHLKFLVNGKNAEPYAVICHGDFWSGNMLFKYDEDSSVPKDFCFLDFQMCRYTSPVTDIAYMLFCCCHPDVRTEKYDELLNDYYSSLSDRLKEAGLNPEKVFSYDAFQEQLHKFGSYGGIMSVYVIHLFTAGDKDVVPEIGERNVEEILMKVVQTNDVYRKCVKQTFYKLIDSYYI